MPLDPRDTLLQTHTPAVMVPRYGSLAPLEQSGHRFLIAEDGVWLEIKRPWVRVRGLLTSILEEHRLPFGRVAPHLGFEGKEFDAEYTFGAEDLQRIETLFVYDAKHSMPDEYAAWGVWNERTRMLEYRHLIAGEASPGSITFGRPKLEAHEHLAVDLHSHGQLEAYFSSTDDDDDRGEVKLSVVVGEMHKEPQFARRLCALNLFFDQEDA